MAKGGGYGKGTNYKVPRTEGSKLASPVKVQAGVGTERHGIVETHGKRRAPTQGNKTGGGTHVHGWGK